MDEQQHYDALRDLLALTRANYLWFHGAHHVVSGVSFVGDNKLYAKIYEAYIGTYDTFVEKSIVILRGPRIADPLEITGVAMKILAQYAKPSDLSAQQIAAVALGIEQRYNLQLGQLRGSLAAGQRLPLGLENAISQTADDHDVWIYQLSQRVRGVSNGPR